MILSNSSFLLNKKVYFYFGWENSLYSKVIFKAGRIGKITTGRMYRGKSQSRIWPLELLNFTGQVNMVEKEKHRGVPVVAQWSTNPTRNHEVAGSIPALAQWAKDPALP